MKRILCVALFTFAATTALPSTAQESVAPPDLVGSWRLVGAQGNFDSDESRRGRGARGLLILDRAGNAFEYFSATGGFGADTSQATPESTLANVGGFWGRFSVDPSAGRIAFAAESGVSPNVRGLEFTRQYELDGDQLIVISADEPHAQGNMRWTWQRMPVVENLSPAYREVVGFWQHVEERRVDTATGEVLNTSLRAPSLIVYTPSGFVGVHFPSVGRESVTTDTPSGEDARAALRGYIGYFGTLSVFPGEVSHNILSGVSPTTGSILRRYAEISGDELVVKLQNNGVRQSGEGPRTVTEVILRRLSGAGDMLPD